MMSKDGPPLPKLPKLKILGVSRKGTVRHNVTLKPGNSDDRSNPKPISYDHGQLSTQTTAHEEEIPQVPEMQPTVTDTDDEWGVRQKLIVAYSDRNHVVNTPCIVCCKQIKQDSHIKCPDCSIFGYFCSETCGLTNHTASTNPFHKPMKWIASERRYKEWYVSIGLHRPDHADCGTQKPRNGIQVFDKSGRLHLVGIKVCSCEEQSVTFIRHGLWPATTVEPKTAYSMELLNTIQYMMLEGKSSLQAICQALRFANDLTAKQGQMMYDRLRGAPFQEFMFFAHQVQSMQFLGADIPDDSQCLACPRVNGDIFFCMDANFGLVHKKSAGSSGRSNHSNRMFADVDLSQEEVATESHQECNNFQAGSVVRSSSTVKKLDITGVFGSVCRHEVPQKFVDMTGGESLNYPVGLIDKLLDNAHMKDMNVHILYDVGCRLDTRLKALKKQSYSKLSLAVPIFHAYGHKPSCQVKHSVRWSKGFGLTDGEAMERLWAFLRRFSPITKEMTLGNRRDLITNALLHYSKKKNSVMDHSLCKSFERAQKVAKEIEESLDEFCATLSLNDSDLETICKDEKERMLVPKAESSQFSPEEKYVQLVASKADAEGKKRTANSSDHQTIRDQDDEIKRLDQELTKAERKIGITRWSTSSAQYKVHMGKRHAKQKRQCLAKMHDAAAEYAFVLSLKAYRERNQKIAARISKQAIRVTTSLRRLVSQYNAIGSTTEGLPSKLVFDEIKKPDAPVYQKLYGIDDEQVGAHKIPRKTHHEIAQLKMREVRAEEEKGLLKKEMAAFLGNLTSRCEMLHHTIERGLPSPGMYTDAMNALERLRSHYTRARKLFKPYLANLPVEPVVMSGPLSDAIVNDDDPTSSSESEDESSSDESSDDEDLTDMLGRP